MFVCTSSLLPWWWLEHFSRNITKLFSKLNLVTDDLSLYLRRTRLGSHWKLCVEVMQYSIFDCITASPRKQSSQAEWLFFLVHTYYAKQVHSKVVIRTCTLEQNKRSSFNKMVNSKYYRVATENEYKPRTNHSMHTVHYQLNCHKCNTFITAIFLYLWDSF